MPHVIAFFHEIDDRARKVVEKHKEDICQSIANEFGYSLDEIFFWPHMLPAGHERYAFNSEGLTLAVDLGHQAEELHDERVEKWKERLLSVFPEIARTEFYPWIREMVSNGHSAHVPKEYSVDEKLENW